MSADEAFMSILPECRSGRYPDDYGYADEPGGSPAHRGTPAARRPARHRSLRRAGDITAAVCCSAVLVVMFGLLAAYFDLI